ncbi:TPA: TIGR04197 family type VII secretion effector, partial [Bacillus wiedmannii]|nr:TIGR04197 family type VII secretion effector [Bacillus wiedmannii]
MAIFQSNVQKAEQIVTQMRLASNAIQNATNKS